MYFNDYKNNLIHTNGARHSFDAQNIVENTWYDDPSSMVAYFYDYYHDDEPDKNIGLHPENSKTKIPVDIKYIINAYQSLAKDTVDYRIMFKPSYQCNIPYYKESFEETCHCEYPLGMYLDIKDQNGIWRKWLVVSEANKYNNDFPNWSILPCTYRYCWVHNGKKYKMWGAPRSQNSYNFGEWESYKTSVQENQMKFVVPYNKETATLFHNMRIIYSPQIETPICWRITKVEGINPFGLMNITLYQDMYNPHTDVIEKDEKGNWIAAWADLIKDNNLPNDNPIIPDPQSFGNYAEITYAGTEPHIKVNGSYKKIILTYYNSNEILKDQTPGEWSYWIDDIDVGELIKVIESDSPNIIKIKFLGDENYLGKTLTIKNIRDDIVGTLQLQIVSL